MRAICSRTFVTWWKFCWMNCSLSTWSCSFLRATPSASPSFSPLSYHTSDSNNSNIINPSHALAIHEPSPHHCAKSNPHAHTCRAAARA